MAVELSSDAQRWLWRLPTIANVLLVALVALSAAHLFWLVWPAPAAHAVAPADSSANSRAGATRDIDIDAIAGAHIFGEQQIASATLEKQKELNAPETHLDLELTGIIADSRGERSRALIKPPQGDQQSYRIDQTIVSGVALHAIYPDRVILDRNGRFETLTLESIKKARALSGLKPMASALPSLSTAESNASAAAAQVADSQDAESASTEDVSRAVNQQLTDVRRQILADPSSAQRYIRLRPARQGGNLVGYRIYPGQNKSLFEKAGLKSGELVTAINGQPLDNPAASLKMLGDLARADTATVTVERNGQPRTLRVDFQ